jgi:hypothetical protein
MVAYPLFVRWAGYRVLLGRDSIANWRLSVHETAPTKRTPILKLMRANTLYVEDNRFRMDYHDLQEQLGTIRREVGESPVFLS